MSLTIAYCCNDKIFDGLYLSILSILRRTKQSINFYILTGNLEGIQPHYQSISAKHVQILTNLVKLFNKQNNVYIYDCTQKYLNSFGNMDFPKITPYNMFKLFLPEFKYNGDTLLYLDTDTLINGDIAQAFDVDMNNVEICGCHVYGIEKFFGSGSTYFNGGVMLINIPFVNKTNLFNKALKYYLTYKPQTLEEAALNKCVTHIKFWDNEYRFNYQKADIQKDTIIKHFVYTIEDMPIIKVKPWDIDGVQNWLNLHNWDEDYQYFLNQKQLLKW